MKKNVSLSKKQKRSGSETGKSEKKILTSLFHYFEKGNRKIEFPASRLSNNY